MPYLAGDVSVLSALRELNSVGKEGQNYFIIHNALRAMLLYGIH